MNIELYVEELAAEALRENQTRKSHKECGTAAMKLLNSSGVRIMQIDGIATIGIWSDLDSPDIRAALQVMGTGELPVRYLDGPGIPIRYKLRHVPGDPVPMNVLRAMQNASKEPWKVRERMLAHMGNSNTDRL